MYSRYADDLTFSTSRRIFPQQIGVLVEGSGNPWSPSEELQLRTQDCGFAINPEKTRLQIRGSRQETTSLIVNEKVNIRQEYYRQTRAMCHRLFKIGTYLINGTLDEDEKHETSNLMILEGKLSFIRQVKQRADRTSTVNRCIGFEAPSGPPQLHYRFMFYKYFVVLERPLIVTEGVSDILYLTSAITTRGTLFPSLADPTNDFKPIPKFLKPSPTVTDIMNLQQGTGGLARLISSYRKDINRYAHTPLAAPVIIIVDNDEGAKGCFKEAKKAMKGPQSDAVPDVSVGSPDRFCHLGNNLYLIKVPHCGGKSSRAIEDLFDPALLETKLNGKSFDKNKIHDAEDVYGKVKFANSVVRQNAGEIDFKGFDPLLALLVGAINHYYESIAVSQSDVRRGVSA